MYSPPSGFHQRLITVVFPIRRRGPVHASQIPTSTPIQSVPYSLCICAPTPERKATSTWVRAGYRRGAAARLAHERGHGRANKNDGDDALTRCECEGRNQRTGGYLRDVGNIRCADANHFRLGRGPGAGRARSRRNRVPHVCPAVRTPAHLL
jgi:hypothetical protein